MKHFIFKIKGEKLYKFPAIILLIFGIVYPSVFVVDASLAYNLPVAHGDTYTTPENTVLNVPAPGVLANDTRAEGNTLNAILVKGAFFGTISLSINGSFSYTPHTGYVGIDTFTYKVNNGTSDSNFATVVIFIIPPYTPPVASNDNYNTPENTQLNIRAPGVLANDTHSAGMTITAAKVTNPSNGTLTLSANGSISYTPNTGYVGTDTFTYKANDGTADSNIATVTITVNAPYTPPVANNDTYITPENTALNVPAPGILANDTDATGTTIAAAKVTNPSNGTLTLSANGSFSYTPNTGYVGTDTFTYKANDGTADSNIATVTITVSAPYTPPVANNDTYITPENTVLNVPAPGILANDTDATGTTIAAAKVTNPSNGTLTLSANGSFSYTPNTGYVGTDTFTYKANDGTADSNIATVTITVSAPYTPPVANNDTYITPENTALNVPAPGILANDTDATGTTIAAAKVTNPSNGTLTLSANGSISYTPNTGYVGTDTFTYKANDGTADSNIATITITVTETPASAGGGGAGTGQAGSAVIIRNQPGITNVSSIIDANGTFNQGITALSDDDQTLVTIESGTNVTTADGKPVKQISIIPTDDPPNPPKGVDIISPMYDFGPSGATFNPAATINLQYDPKNIPADVSESNLVIGYYDNKTADWITLASTVDTIRHNVTAQTGHFSLFAVLSGSTSSPSIPTTSPSTTIIANIPSSSPIVPANTPSTIAANLQPTPILTTPSVPAAVILSDIKISPEEIFAGKSITISTVVTNPGKVADTYRVIVSIDNVEISAKDISLDSGTSETVSFNVVQNTAGRHILAINGTQQVFEVRAIPVVVAPPWPIWIWIVLGAFAFAVSLLTTVLMGRRRRNSA